MIDIQAILRTRAFIKWSAVFEAAGLNASSMRTRMAREQEITVAEARAIERVLSEAGITLRFESHDGVSAGR